MQTPSLTFVSPMGDLMSPTQLSLINGSIPAFFSIVIGAATTMKYQCWRMMREA